MIVIGAEQDAQELLILARAMGIKIENVPRDSLTELNDKGPFWILPDKYPDSCAFTEEEKSWIKKQVQNGSSIFIEFDVPFDACSYTRELCKFERCIVRQEVHPVIQNFQPLDILDPHQAYFNALQNCGFDYDELLSIGGVSGYDKAVFGLPKQTAPLVLEQKNNEPGRLLWSCTSISQPEYRRYSPRQAWKDLLQNALLYLHNEPEKSVIKSSWINLSAYTEPREWVQPGELFKLVINAHLGTQISIFKNKTLIKKFVSACPEESIKLSLEANEHNFQIIGKRNEHQETIDLSISVSSRKHYYEQVVDLALEWYNNAGLLIDQSGNKGVLEGFNTTIDINGNQPLCLHEGMPNERTDCNIQSAFAFLMAGETFNRTKFTRIGTNLIDFTRQEFQYRDKSVMCGLWKWFRKEYAASVFYSDDNGWAGFFTLLWGLQKNDALLIESGLHTAIGLYQTWGANGHRRRRIDLSDFYHEKGREGLRTELTTEEIYKSPHYEAPSMALMGLASLATGDIKYVERIYAGLDDYIAKFPNSIIYQHSENDDMSKFIIALLFCAAATDRKDYFEAASKILGIFIDAQLTCGAIPDIDRLDIRYGKNRSNEDYGTFESSIFQNPEDHLTDQMYGSSFMLLALYFASLFLPEDKIIQQSLHKLGDYLARIQIKDNNKAFLKGAWMRSFDPERWEYAGAAGDWGWGPFAMETGWSQSIIVSALSCMVAEQPIVLRSDVTQQRNLKKQADEIFAVHQSIEKEWQKHTPKPKERVLNQTQPDLMI